MEELLRRLLNRLERIGDEHEEIYDTECRDRMSAAVFEGFLRNSRGYVVGSEFGLYSRKANLAVKRALDAYITNANAKAAELGLTDFHHRLAAFQNAEVHSDDDNYFDDFFGWWNPEELDSLGNVIEPS